MQNQQTPDNQGITDCGYRRDEKIPTQPVPFRCSQNTCSSCAPVNALQVAGALAMADPRRAVRVSGLPDCWEEVRRRINRLIQRIRRSGYAFEWAFHREVNPNNNGSHVHGWQCGDYIPQPLLQDSCDAVGLGLPDIRRFDAKGAPITYGMKMVLPPANTPPEQAAADLRTYLDLNGNRLVHATRGFWRDEQGRVTTLRAAMQLVAQRHQRRRPPNA